MHVDEAERHRLHTRLADVLGEDGARTLMSMLPPVGWADVATKDDLRALEAMVRGDIGRQLAELETGVVRAMQSLESRVHTTLRHQLLAMIAAMFTTSTLTVAAAAAFV